MADDAAAAEEPPLRSVFARTWGYSLGKALGPDDAALARAAWQVVRERWPNGASDDLRHLHVWRRGRSLPGDEGHDTEAATVERAAGAALLEQRPSNDSPAPALNAVAAAGELVLDRALVERDEWWVGWHRAASPETRWPGGVPAIALPERLISRAYLKIVEALQWSELLVAPATARRDLQRAGRLVPRLAQRGLLVTGIDPAEMDATVLAHRTSLICARARRT